ncbi:ABC transporter F family member 4-like [Helianthus annuus]|uniref:ABC transporter F family member 4-like n=1 Tax=Helianthus annuus TaxID=4232 RepID=UPI000B906D79|nr:ABC transporter F family member 4-like [Helianthus annuus]
MEKKQKKVTFELRSRDGGSKRMPDAAEDEYKKDKPKGILKRQYKPRSEEVSIRKSKRKHNETTEDDEGYKGYKGIEGVNTRNEGIRTRNTRSVKSKSTSVGNDGSTYEVDMEDVDGNIEVNENVVIEFLGLRNGGVVLNYQGKESKKGRRKDKTKKNEKNEETNEHDEEEQMNIDKETKKGKKKRKGKHAERKR